MPLYRFKCATCEKEGHFFRKIEERDRQSRCECGGRYIRQFDAPMVQAEIEPYESPATGRLITSRAEMREDLKRSGCILNEPGLKQDIDRRRKELIERNYSAIDRTVDDLVTAAVATGKLET